MLVDHDAVVGLSALCFYWRNCNQNFNDYNCINR